MSAFEKLPREIRDLIYEYCLLFEGEIVPFPTDYEFVEIEKRPRVTLSKSSSSQQIITPAGGQNALLGYSYVKRELFQTEDKLCVALLGVNSTIHDEAASVLFGKNTWRLSPGYHEVADDKSRLWETYAKYFRHVVTKFDARDVDLVRLLDISMAHMCHICYAEPDWIEEDIDHFDQTGTPNVHEEELSLLMDGFVWKRSILLRMNLKSLSFDFSTLFCTNWCCRREALQSCLVFMGPNGPWSRSEQERGRNSETELRTDVKVFGLKNVKEIRFLQETWCFKVE